MQIPYGQINLDSEFGRQIGFTSDKFDYDCYLWGEPDNNRVWLSLIISKKKGNFCKLIQNLQKNNIKFCIPTPSNRMQEIGKKQGWRKASGIEYGEYVEYLTNEEK